MFLFIHLAETVVETTTAILQEAERQKMIKLKIQTDYKIYKLHFVIVVALVLCINRNQPFLPWDLLKICHYKANWAENPDWLLLMFKGKQPPKKPNHQPKKNNDKTKRTEQSLKLRAYSFQDLFNPSNKKFYTWLQ